MVDRFSETARQISAASTAESRNGQSSFAGSAAVYRPKPRKNPRLRLFCFTYAGGGAAAFRLWPNHLPENIEVVAVHPPGRAHRLSEPPLTRIETMVVSALDSLTSLMDRPFAVFGHSLGALVAGEFVRALQAKGRSVEHLFVSSRRSLRHAAPLLHQLPDGDFVAAMNERYQGIPVEILAHPDLLALLLPALRADIEALETFHPPHDRPKIACPTTVYGGEFDQTVLQKDLESWNEETVEPCRIRVFRGNHFYLNTAPEAMLADLSTTLELVNA
jgi:medium-chain acyl-[acyl-carrier-protein] hydrolase